MASSSVILPADIDEAEARGLVRDLMPARDHEFGLMCAVVFEPDGHAKAVQDFTPPFEEFRKAIPAGAKLHITDAFRPGNESWREVAESVRGEYLRLIQTTKPMVIYAARRLRLARAAHERTEDLQKDAKAARRSPVKVVGENRPSDTRIEDDHVAMDFRSAKVASLILTTGTICFSMGSAREYVTYFLRRRIAMKIRDGKIKSRTLRRRTVVCFQ